TQEVLATVIVERCIQVRCGQLPFGLDLATELPVLALESRVTPQMIDRPMLRRGHEPGSRVVRDARRGPLLEGGDERILCEILGHADIAHDPREPGYQLG